jgi:hypothetical protein
MRVKYLHLLPRSYSSIPLPPNSSYRYYQNRLILGSGSPRSRLEVGKTLQLSTSTLPRL